MAAINAILFDVGGVLLTNGWDQKQRAAVLDHFSVSQASCEDRHEAANDAWEKGLITAGEYLERTVFFEPRPFTPAEFLAEIKAQSQLLENGAMNVIQGLHARSNVSLGMLNNESRELNAYRIERFQLRRYFNLFVSSCYVGLRKPDTRIFELALDLLQCSADRVAFVDDRQGNCDAAARLGIRAICFRGERELTQELAGLGVLIDVKG